MIGVASLFLAMVIGGLFGGIAGLAVAMVAWIVVLLGIEEAERRGWLP